MYDPECAELAGHFLEGEPDLTEAEYRKLLDSLSEAIQAAVEGWFSEWQARVESDAAKNTLAASGGL